jgi:hypothetical protein
MEGSAMALIRAEPGSVVDACPPRERLPGTKAHAALKTASLEVSLGS